MERTDHTKERLNDAVTTGQEAVRDGAAAAKEKAAELKEKAAVTAQHAAHTVADTMADPEKRKAAQTAAEQWIRENPWATIAAAFAVGVKVGRRLHLR